MQSGSVPTAPLDPAADVIANLSEADYIEIISAKTAALFAAASKSGAVTAGADMAKVQGLYDYGLNLGLAFQIQDDVLDYSGSAGELGKNAGDDFAEGKSTLPLLLAVKATADTEAHFWDRTIAKRDQKDGDFLHARNLIIESGALEATRRLAQDYASKAIQSLSIFAPGPWREALEAVALYSVERAK